jgi:hypothetical protein
LAFKSPKEVYRINKKKYCEAQRKKFSRIPPDQQTDLYSIFSGVSTYLMSWNLQRRSAEQYVTV